MGCGSSAPATDEEGRPSNSKKLKKPKSWKSTEPLTRSALVAKREEFWDTSPHYGGQKVIWDALKAATEAETALAQAIVDGAGIIVTSDDLSCCYDERGAKYDIPQYVLSDPTNLKEE